MAYPGDEPWWKPRYWRKRTWAIVGVVVAVIIVIVIVVPVEVAQANRYPNYSTLDYSLVDECEFNRQEEERKKPIYPYICIHIYLPIDRSSG